MAVAFYSAAFVFLSVLFGIRSLLQFLRKREACRSAQLSIPDPVSSSPSRSLWKYEVFLSFRGADVRGKFISHLYSALTDEGIDTFYDDNKLVRGDPIWLGLSEAIKKSRFAIVVLSENYATSRWCLEELSLLHEFAKKNLLKIIPIFYGLKTADVKEQNELALAKHAKKYDAEKVSRWRTVLAEVGNISGWESTNWKEEAEFVKEIVKNVFEELISDSSGDSTELVGMSLHKQQLELLLAMDSNDFRMVGVLGMGGRGKTTIARYVFEELSSQFGASCFLAKVKEDFKKFGPSHLRNIILSEILPKGSLNVNALFITSDAMKRKLCGKKVLLVLDDVDDIQQLRELAGSREWFGPGSRIIITTQDKRVLDLHVVEHIYNVKPLMPTQALQLFSKHAFRMNYPPEDFMKLSIDIVEQLDGLPLALEVIGVTLYSREIALWEDELLILKNRLDKSISRVLRVSYDALDDEEKDVFLYIAGCFNGEYKERARKVLDPFVIASGLTLKTLMEKSLISMSKNTRLWVHDLLQDMAKEIICEGKKEQPWMRKMLWMFSEIKDLFSETRAAENIVVESILLNMAEETELYINSATFVRMRNLKFLKIHNNLNDGRSKICMVNDLDYLPPLRYLHWEAYTLISLPSHFQTDYLVELNLPDSSVETLWSGTQDLRCLKHMNLNRCKNLIEIPNLSKARSLESLCLCECKSLVELPPSLGHLDKLVKLSLRGCTKLKNLPSNINLKSLKLLSLDECTSIEDFPFVSDSIEELGLNGTSIEVVPPSIERLLRLSDLRLSQCKRLKNLPDTIGNMASLRHLWLAYCPNITVFPVLGNGIEILGLNGTEIKEVPSSIGDKVNLSFLDMSECQRLQNLPPTLSKLKKLKFLYLRGCTNITELPKIAGEMRKLDLYGTSIENCGILSEDDALEMHKRDTEFVYGFFTRYARNYKRKKNLR